MVFGLFATPRTLLKPAPSEKDLFLCLKPAGTKPAGTNHLLEVRAGFEPRPALL